MSEFRNPVSRRRFVGMASALGALPIVGRAALPAAAQDASGETFSNGIDATRYLGGDGSYEKYKNDGIRLGLIEAFPVNYTDPETGERTGWNTDIVLAALGHIGIDKIEFVDGPWESMVPGLQSGRFDLLASDVHVTPERIEVIDFSAPAFWYGDALFVPKGNPGNLHSWDDLAGKRVGVVLGTNYADWLQARDDLGELKTYKDTTQMAADMVAGRLDAAISEDSNFTGYLAQNPDIPIEAVADYVAQSDLSDWTRFGFRIGENDINNVFSRAIMEMLINGEILAILQKYGLGTRNLAAFPGM
ncbi:MAG: transporter substrate-binding domain-containing protein [Thermomicrobiales bacterium]|nr:transporter substrate-binding domain-containing protein [Thermomicrobiales bacterium]